MAESVLRSLHIRPDDRFIAIKENTRANSNFLISCLLQKCFDDGGNVCFIMTHNTIGHYHIVGKRFEYDILAKIKEGKLKTVDVLKEITNSFTTMDIEATIKYLFKNVVQNTAELSKNGPTTIVIDDISHLLDIGISFKDVIMYFKVCMDLVNTYNAKLIINSYCSTEENERLINLLFHSADLWVTVSALKTGISKNVTGTLDISRPDNYNKDVALHNFLHFKLEEREVLVFQPGKDM